MNKNIMLTILSILMLLMIVYTFFDETVDNKTSSVTQKYQENKTHEVNLEEQKQIKYEQSTQNSDTHSSNKSKKKISIPKVEYIETYDIFKKYKIVLAPSIKKRYAKKSYILNGKINNSKFTIQVPEYLIYEDNINIEITNLKDGTKQTIPATFLSNLNNSEYHSISIDTNDISNINYETSVMTLPQ